MKTYYANKTVFEILKRKHGVIVQCSEFTIGNTRIALLHSVPKVI